MRARDEDTLLRLARDYGWRTIADTMGILSEKQAREEHTRLKRRGIGAYLLASHNVVTLCERFKARS